MVRTDGLLYSPGTDQRRPLWLRADGLHVTAGISPAEVTAWIRTRHGGWLAQINVPAELSRAPIWLPMVVPANLVKPVSGSDRADVERWMQRRRHVITSAPPQWEIPGLPIADR